MKVKALPYELIFKQAAGTSRGVIQRKKSWMLTCDLEHGMAVGECGVFAGLSSDDRPAYESILRGSIRDFNAGDLDLASLKEWPSIRCGWEMLLADIASNGNHILCENSFYNGTPIMINGLIWMGSQESMLSQVDQRLKDGFTCIKLKIGGIDFEEELALLDHVRERYPEEVIEIRLDANGAFAPIEAMDKIERLAKYDIHSIEQPIASAQIAAMAAICADSPIPIALDEELIGVHEYTQKKKLIESIRPQFLIIKPSLHGGFAGGDEWIEIAERENVQWWATSALESNIGLNAIAQWTASKNIELPQGLGTGSLYTNNIASPLKVDKGSLSYDKSKAWDFSMFSK